MKGFYSVLGIILFSTVSVFSITPDGNLFYNPFLLSAPLPHVPLELSSLHQLPDSIPTWSDNRDSWAVLTGAEYERYKHGVLGDAIEARSITVTDREGKFRFAIDLAYPDVIESRYVIWADTDGDGSDELTATVSNRFTGASIRIYNGETGDELVSGGAIGRGGRWLHAIGWAAFTGAEPVLAVVETPHLGGILIFYSLIDGVLTEVDRLTGFSSHKYGSRNLFMAAAVDSDQNGISELYLPNRNRNELKGVRWEEDKFRIFWRKDSPFSDLDTPLSVKLNSDGQPVLTVENHSEEFAFNIP